MKRLIIFSLAICLILTGISLISSAQVQEIAENRGSAAAWQALLRLRNTVTVLHITAHPDDEDAALLTWLARGQGVRTGLLTLNRGEGGANLMEITAVPGGVQVRCPGCGQTDRYTVDAGVLHQAAFVHEDACPVHAQIQAAIHRFEAEVVRRG